ncbi:hypothetical protein BBJ66_00885 [Rhizobium sp. RSm-3]|nr:hypothetical protein BBJ66_00885 [Rhizobium sp. RSm-3]
MSPQVRALSFAPTSVDEKARTVEMIASTGAGVLRHDMEGAFNEMLSLTPGAVDLSRAEGMPLLDSHRQDGLDRVLGVVRGVRIEKGQLIVTAQFSERAEAVFKDVAAGIIRNVSVGYGVDDFEDRVDPQSGQRLRTVTKWTLHEVSLVPVGADAGAKTRGITMPQANNTATAASATATTSANANPATMTRAQSNAEIRALAETFGLGDEFSNGLIDREATVDEARAAAVEQVRQRSNRQTPQTRVTVVANHDDPEAIVGRMGEALYVRGNPRHKPSDAARQYVNMTTLDMARQMLQLRGMHTTGLSPAETITRALNSTSDFPLVFADTANRALRPGYEAAAAVLKRVARQTTAKDFRNMTKLQIGEAAGLEKVNENGEYKHSTISEAGESYGIATYGRIFGLTRQAIINDDIGAFVDVAGKFGAAAAEFEAQFLVDILEGAAGFGPVMKDGKTLFHADHGNLAEDGVDLTSTPLPRFGGLDVARLAMRKQKGLSGRPINVVPKYLLVAPEAETAAETLLATLQPNSADGVNPFAGKLEMLVEARLSSPVRWYVAGDPATIEGLEYAYLAGQEGPQTETRAGFEVDGVETKVRLDFGAAFVDYRGWFMNPGEDVTT